MKQTDNMIIALLRDRKFRTHRHLILQLFVLLITISVFFDTPDKLNVSWDRFIAWAGYYMTINLLIYSNAYILVPQYLIKNKISKYLLSVLVLILICLYFIIILQDHFYDIALTHNKPDTIIIFFSVMSSVFSMGLIVFGISALLLFKHWISYSQQADELKSETLLTELKYLKNQINPHFLFNMLNNANILIKEDPELASQIILKLDSLLRYQIEDNARDRVILSDDIRFLRTFLELEKIRRDRFEYTLTDEGSTNMVTLPPFLFLPFVENAVKHSLSSKGISYINISFKAENKTVIFTCVNSKPVKPTQKSGGLGLENIKKRLELLFKNNYILKITETEVTYSIYLKLKL